MFQVVDLYGQAPFPRSKCTKLIYTGCFSRTEATDFIIKDLEFAESNLGASANIGVASKAAAQALLAKVYLNRAVYTAATVGGPFTFAQRRYG
jgi:hypothetical protein